MRSNGATTPVAQLASLPGQEGQMPTATPRNGKDKDARGRPKTAVLRHQGDVCVGSRRNGRRTGFVAALAWSAPDTAPSLGTTENSGKAG